MVGLGRGEQLRRAHRLAALGREPRENARIVERDRHDIEPGHCGPDAVEVSPKAEQQARGGVAEQVCEP